MNNILPLLLFVLSAAKNGNTNGNDLTKNLLSAFSSSLGKENGELISSLLSGNFNPEKMLPLLIKSLAAEAGNSPLSDMYSNENTPENSDNSTFSKNVEDDYVKSDFGEKEYENERREPLGADENGKNEPYKPNYLKPIRDIADERINFALAHYFSNG